MPQEQKPPTTTMGPLSEQLAGGWNKKTGQYDLENSMFAGAMTAGQGMMGGAQTNMDALANWIQRGGMSGQAAGFAQNQMTSAMQPMMNAAMQQGLEGSRQASGQMEQVGGGYSGAAESARARAFATPFAQTAGQLGQLQAQLAGSALGTFGQAAGTMGQMWGTQMQTGLGQYGYGMQGLGGLAGGEQTVVPPPPDTGLLSWL